MLVLEDTPNILIVDDQPASIHLLRQAIASLGTIFFATDGETAIDLARRLKPALIILDIEMPGMDGYMVLEALRADRELDDCLVIFITGHDRKRHELHALHAGGIDYLQKPLDLPIARARIDNLLKLSTARRALKRAQRDMEDIVCHLPAFVAHWDTGLHNIFCNDRDGRWFGVGSAAMRGRCLQEVFGPALDGVLEPNCRAAMAGTPVSFELEFPRATGPSIYGLVAVVGRYERNQPIGVLMLITDLSARHAAEIALHDERELLRVTLDSIGDAVIATDPEGCVSFLNPIAESMTGWTSKESLGHPIELVMPLSVGPEGPDALNPIRLAIKERRIVGMAMDCYLRRHDGRRVAVEDSAAPILDHRGRLRGAIVVFHDVSEMRAMAVKMSHLANHDALTNLPNRLLLRDRCEQALQKARRNQVRVGLLSIDIDHFKAVNIAAGYSVGDQLLQQIAMRLSQALRTCDTLSRQGGDEFVVLLSEVTHLDEVSEFAMRTLELIAMPVHIDQHCYELSASIGISLFPDDSSDIEQLYSHADSALYQAKQDGRGRTRFFAWDIEDRMRMRMALQRQLGNALSQGRLEVHYQPKVDLAEQRIVGVEALVRWRRNGDQIASPGEFIAVAEESGQIIALGQFVLRQACHDASSWHARGHSMSVAVNVSARQLAEPDFVATVVQVLDETGLESQSLQLEITEGTLVSELDHIRDALEKLKSMGVLIAIDDFGTGYSSLTYLKRFPVDVIKIDQSFVRGILEDRSDRAIISAIVHLADSLGIQLIAEGVENETQAEALTAMGCHVMQGFLYGKAMAPAQLETLL